MIDLSPADSSLACVRAAASGTATGYLPTRHGRLDFSRRTAIMAILNVTPDSFYDGGRRLDPGKAIADVIEMAEAGADVIDIGGESTRPGARPVSEDEELERVLPVICVEKYGYRFPSILTNRASLERRWRKAPTSSMTSALYASMPKWSDSLPPKRCPWS